MERKEQNHRKMSMVFITVLIALISLYCITAFTECPGVSTARDLWIETAMTTGDHQWLAKIFPQSVIDKVMSKKVDVVEGIAGLGSLEIDILSKQSEKIKENYKKEKEAEEYYSYWWESDPLGQIAASETGIDANGNEVVFNDIEEGVLISKVKGGAYVGYLAQIADPSRIKVETTEEKEEKGKLICDYLADFDAVLAINASGFRDYNGEGMGGETVGRVMASDGEWGVYEYSLATVAFDDKNRLIAGNIEDWSAYNIRAGIQFGPVLVKDGEIITEGSAGWGIQPRTVIGQRSDGAVFFLVIDGRKAGYSIGATMGDCAELLKSYGAITAAACDGGSSSVMAYGGQIINKPSTPMTTGRYLPSAFVVSKKSITEP